MNEASNELKRYNLRCCNDGDGHYDAWLGDDDEGEWCKFSEADAALKAKDEEIASLRKDAERLDFVEQNLCRAGDIMKNGQAVGIMKCWQVITQCDDSLRATIDLLRAAITGEPK